MAVTPYLAVRGAPDALKFYEEVFGGVAYHVVKDDESGTIVHARVRLAGGEIHVHEYSEGEVLGVAAPHITGSTSVSVRLLLDSCANVDRVFARAIDSGAKIAMAPANACWNEYYGRFLDPFGHAWAIGALLDDN